LSANEVSDPVSVVAAIRQKQRCRLQFTQKSKAELIVVCLTGGKRELHGQPVSIDDSMNFSGKAPS
jgi:hypothetical protein